MNSESSVPAGAPWIKAKRSGSDGQCVEMRRHGGVVEVRDSKDPDPALPRGRGRAR